MRYDLTDLKLFRATAATANLTAAAEQIFMSVGSASYRLGNLERAVGTKLFQRTSRGMEITVAGELLLKHVAKVLSALEAMHEDMSGFGESRRGRVRILANSSSLNGFLPPRLALFLSRNPLIDVEVDEQDSDAIALAIANGVADIGVTASPCTSGELEVHPFGRDDLVLAVPTSHRLAGEAEIWLEDALDCDFVGMHRSTSNFHFLATTASKLGKRLRIRMQAPSFHAVLTLVAAGVGVALVPRSVVGTEYADTCRYVRLRDDWAVRRLTALARPDIARLPIVAKLLAELRQGPEATS